MSKRHSNAPAIVVGDWATGRYIADAIKVADPSFVSGKIIRVLVEKYGLNKRDIVRNNRNERNDSYGRYAFYHVPTIKHWCKDAGRDFDTPEKNGIGEIDMIAREFELDRPTGETLENVKAILRRYGLGEYVKFLQKTYATANSMKRDVSWELFGQVSNGYAKLAVAKNEY